MTDTPLPPESALSRIVSAVLAGAGAGGAVSALLVWSPALWAVASREPTLEKGVAWLVLYAGAAALSATLFLVVLTVLALIAHRWAADRPLPGAAVTAAGGGLLAGALTLIPAVVGGGLDHIPWLFVAAAVAGGVAAGAAVSPALAGKPLWPAPAPIA